MIVSTELDEVIELADRIAVLYKGKLVGVVPAGTGRDVLGLMMAGIPRRNTRTRSPGAAWARRPHLLPRPPLPTPKEATMSDKHPPKHAAGEPGPEAQSASPLEDRTADVVSVGHAGGAMEPSAVPVSSQSGQLPGGPDTVLRRIFTGNGMVSVLAVCWRCSSAGC
jgi:hypothetical protein